MNQNKKRLKAIIFDMDGTIIDTNHAWLEATQKTIVEAGGSFCPKTQTHHIENSHGVSLSQSAQIIKQAFNLDLDHGTLADKIINHACSIFNQGVPFINGFEDFHKKLSEKNIKSCIATNSHGISLDVLKKGNRLNSFFGSHIFCAADVKDPKPAPDLFLLAAEKLGVDPSECVVFEDSITGFKAAQAAGMKCIAIKSGHNKDFLDHVETAIEHYEHALEKLHELFDLNPEK